MTPRFLQISSWRYLPKDRIEESQAEYSTCGNWGEKKIEIKRDWGNLSLHGREISIRPPWIFGVSLRIDFMKLIK